MHSGVAGANWMRRCFDCGFVLGRKQLFCPRCGARQRPERAGGSRSRSNERHPEKKQLEE
jgi:rRNA maturation endonuclease Nob1